MPSRSASASAAGTTGTLGCPDIIVCVSSKSSACDAAPLISAADSIPARWHRPTSPASPPSIASRVRISASGSRAPAIAHPNQSSRQCRATMRASSLTAPRIIPSMRSTRSRVIPINNPVALNRSSSAATRPVNRVQACHPERSEDPSDLSRPIVARAGSEGGHHYAPDSRYSPHARLRPLRLHPPPQRPRLRGLDAVGPQSHLTGTEWIRRAPSRQLLRVSTTTGIVRAAFFAYSMN